MSSSAHETLRRRMLFRTCALITKLALHLVAKLDLPEVQSIPDDDRGLIIVMNHRSLLDFFIGLVAFSKWRIYPYPLVRGDYCQIPILGPLLLALGAIPAGRGMAAADRAMELLRAGHMVAITPEGRIPRAEERIDGISSFKPGLGRLASTMGTPILLMGVVNADKCWEPGRRHPYILSSLRGRPTIILRAETLCVDVESASSDIVEESRRRLSRILSNIDSVVSPP